MQHSAVDNYAEFLSFCWLGALMHDIGKLSVSFLISKERNSPVPDRHGQIVFSDIDIVPPFLLKLLSTPLDDLCNVPEELSGYCLLYFICSHHGCERCGGDHRCGSDGGKDGGKALHPLTVILQSADRLESSNPPDLLKQSLLTVKRSDFFGRESPLYPHRFRVYRERIYQDISRIFERDGQPAPVMIARASAVLSKYLSRGLSETRRRAHDIDIFSHSHATAVYMKLILIDLISSGSIRRNQRWSSLLMEPQFRTLKVFCSDEGSSVIIHRLETVNPCGALIYDAPGELFFYVGASVTEERLRKLLDCAFTLSPPRFAGLPLSDADGFIHHSPQAILQTLPQALSQPPPQALPQPPPQALPHTVCLDLRRCTALARNLTVTEPEEIDPDMTMEKIHIGLEQTLAYPDFCTILLLHKKKRSLARHISHMEQGIIHRADQGLRKALVTARSRMEELEHMEKACSSVEKRAKEWGWRSKSDAAADVWGFLSKVLSPVRPPHMTHLARKWNRFAAQAIEGDDLARILILSKQMNLSRLFSLLRDTKKFFHRLASRRRHRMTRVSLTLPDDDVLKLFRGSSWREYESVFTFPDGDSHSES